ncbi:MAG TPA: molecular chaperone HtpG [Stellaceae bacterium]|jgi:molecular chaperone HtpG|nr:molecular chaperone HtpG [Stellaceae bacterium]
MTDQAAPETRTFQAEVSRLLDIVAHSLYSEKEIFLRELVSNASDACDRLRYAALTEPALAEGNANYRVVLTPVKSSRTLTVADNGIGMNHDELIDNLGTIARSGTAAFMSQLNGAEDKDAGGKDMSLIGQFGVGFYSAFMVADKVEVLSRKAGDTEGWRWESDGKGSFTVEPAPNVPRGARITLHMREGDDEYLETHRLQQIVKRYSDHIALPIVLADGNKEETINTASALWTRPRTEITAEQYKEFYHHVGQGFDDPWLTLHARAEGVLEYTYLLFVPSQKPFDLFDPERKPRLKLYVRRVFITDEGAELLPAYLRFVRGIVDSEDLPLNISREMLQANPTVTRIRQALTRRVLSELAKKASDAPAEYTKFWDDFGAVLKEGLYEDRDQREALLPLMRFRTTGRDGLISLEEYVAAMRPGQEAIYTITGDNLDLLRKSPQIEGFRARGVEVLLLTDPIDEFWVNAVGTYQEKPFKSATRGGVDLDKITPANDEKEDAAKPEPPPKLASLIAIFKLALGDVVKDVRGSERLTDSAVCLVADEGDIDMHLERLLKQHRQLDTTAKRILELNPQHRLIERLAASVGEVGASDQLSEFAWLLLDQARIVEGEQLPDPAAFARRLASLLERGLPAA